MSLEVLILLEHEEITAEAATTPAAFNASRLDFRFIPLSANIQMRSSIIPENQKKTNTPKMQTLHRNDTSQC